MTYELALLLYHKFTNTDLIKFLNLKIITKNIKLQPVPSSMPSPSLTVRSSGINSASNGIEGKIACNFIFLVLWRKQDTKSALTYK